MTLAITIKLVFAEQEADFIRHARTATFKSVGEKPTPEAIEPTPFGMYFIAYHGERRIGMAEIAFHDQVYRSYAESPYPESANLDQFCPIEAMAGIRTIYVDPDYRHKAGSLYLQLIRAGAETCAEMGCRFATATTCANNPYLNRLYRKTGGRALPLFRMPGFQSEVAGYVFSTRELLDSKLMRRAAAGAAIEVDAKIARTIRLRNRWDREELAA